MYLMAYDDCAMRVHLAQSCLYSLIMKITILLLMSYHTSGGPTIRENHLDEKLLDNVLSALERTSNFFAEDYASLNVDGMFGIRLSQGSIEGSVEDCSSSKIRCPADLVKRLERITSSLSNTAEMAMPYIEEEDPKYFRMFHPTIDAPYVVGYVSERLGEDSGKPGLETSYAEDNGDICYSKLLGTYTDNDRPTPKCTVSDICWKYMTKADTASYKITHQLLYFILAEKNGCIHELQKYSEGSNTTSVRDTERRLCGMIYSEAKHEAIGGTVAVLWQDLFLEQSVLCSILGFQDFVNTKWIQMVLGWQNANGCFSLPHDLASLQNELNGLQDKQRQLLDLLYEEGKQIDQNYPAWNGRQLLREKSMNGDCLSHKTGLGVGAFGAYTRQLIRQLYGE